MDSFNNIVNNIFHNIFKRTNLKNAHCNKQVNKVNIRGGWVTLIMYIFECTIFKFIPTRDEQTK